MVKGDVVVVVVVVRVLFRASVCAIFEFCLVGPNLAFSINLPAMPLLTKLEHGALPLLMGVPGPPCRSRTPFCRSN